MNYGRLVFVILVVLVSVRCDYELQVHLEHYKNPTHSEADGRPCCTAMEDSSSCACSNRFTLCILSAEAGFDVRTFILSKRYVCPEAWLSFITGIVGEEEDDRDDLSFVNKSLIDPLNDVPNPIVITSEDPWPGSFKLVIAVKNRVDMFKEPFVDYVDKTWQIDGDTKEFESEELLGEERLSTFLVGIRVLCINNTQGKYCNETIEEETAVRVLAAQGNDENSEEALHSNIDSGHQLLVISLSVIGAIFGVLILVSLVSFTSYITCCLRKKQKERSSPSESEPFLKTTTGNSSGYPSYVSHPGGQGKEDVHSNTQSHSYQSVEGDSNSGMYTEVPHNRVQQRMLHHMAESARRASLQQPGTGLYSIIRKGDLVMSTPSEEDEGDENRPVSGYSVITRESMAGYVSEELSDVEELDEEEVDEEEEDMDGTSTLTRQGIVEELTIDEEEEEEEEEEESKESDGLLQQVPENVEVDESIKTKPRPRMPTPPSD